MFKDLICPLFISLVLFAHFPVQTANAQTEKDPIFSSKQPVRPLSRIKTVTIDAGHGGKDFGAKSRNIVLEKDFTRKLANALKKKIETQNGDKVRVILTRPGLDETSQQRRAFKANSRRGEIYLSLHTAGGFDQSSRDLGIYISERGKPASTSWKETNKKHGAANAVIAEKLKNKLNEFYKHKKFFIRRSGSVPLYGIDMPGIVVEVMALNDPRGESMIAQPGFYERMADVLYSALVEYDKTL